jgi:hypothetical protein
MTEEDSRKNLPVTVVCGANEQEMDVDGLTVREITSQLEDIMNIPIPHHVFLGGQTVTDDCVIHAGDRIEIVKPAGNKG